MKRAILAVCALLVCLPLHAEGEQFVSRRAVLRDAEARLARAAAQKTVTQPSQGNYVRAEGLVGSVYLSGGFGAFGLNGSGLFDARFECGNSSQALGCAALANQDQVLVFAHLTSYLSCRVDGTDNAVTVNLIYRFTPNQFGGSWTLLTT